MTRLLAIGMVMAILAITAAFALIVLRRFARTTEYLEGHWTEPEDGFAPGELPQADPRCTELRTYLIGRQGRQATAWRVGRGWEQ